jgi:hypothetical protein
MKRNRWQRIDATVELCEPTVGTDKLRYTLTISYEVDGELFVTDALSNQPLEESSRVTLEYDTRDPRRNSLNYPRRERRLFIVVTCCAAAILAVLLGIAIFGL